jgi:hypothetical protein
MSPVHALIAIVFLLCTFACANVLSTRKIPKIVFTYWQSDDCKSTDFVMECIDSWRTCCPDWTIHVLNDATLHRFTDLKQGEEIVQHFADRLRLDLLERYGGVWMDATIWMNKSLNWIHAHHESVIGFKNPIRPETGVMENWFIACQAGSPFIREWKREFARLQVHDNFKRVPDDILSRVENPTYLMQNVAWAMTYRNNPKLRKTVKLLDSKESVFALQWKCNWDPIRFARVFALERHQHEPFVKITQVERRTLVQRNLMKGT